MDSCTRIFMLIIVIITLLTCHFGICMITESSSFSEINCIPSEREALLRFKHHLKDPSNRLSSWNASNPNCCNWVGVFCSDVTSHVLQLHLNISFPSVDDEVDDEFDESSESYEAYTAYERTLLAGEIDYSLVDLKHLSYLDLSGNDFRGMQIPSFLCEITTLTYLNLSFSGFDGKIPDQIGNLSNLIYLDLAFSVKGIIPYQIGNLTNLIHLDLRSYYQHEPILFVESPQWLLGLSSLQYLDLSGTSLSKSHDWLQSMQTLPSLVELHLQGCTFGDYGEPSTLNFSSLLSLSISVAPKWIFQLSKLVSLQIGPFEYFSGVSSPIPHDIQNLTLLENLDLSHNSFDLSLDSLQLYGLHHLKFLNLGYNNLYGTISDGLGNLTSLVYLDLSCNQLEGVIPTFVRNLTSLVSLDFSSNQLKGVIPTSLGNLISLVDLHLSDNQFNGVIPSSLGNLTSLVSLDLSYNQLERDIPTSLGKLTSLARLYLSHNQLGVIRTSLGNLVSLVKLDLSNNKLKGVIPTSLGNLISLIKVDMSNNQLEGVIPTSLGDLGSLMILYLSYNQLEGSIPSSLGNLTSLVKLDLSNNQLEGVIPTSFGNLTSMINLDLSKNQLKGVIPRSLKKLCNLRKISFSNLKSNQHVSEIIGILTSCASSELKSLIASNCQISGHFTNQLGMFKNLVTRDFHNNSIVGSLPQTFEKLSSLTFLDLSNNKLSGNPFEILGSLSNLSNLYIHDNLFQGVVNEANLANFANLSVLSASGNSLTLKVGDNWQPSFQVDTLEMNSWQLGPSFPSWIQSQKNLNTLDISNTGISDSIPTWFWRKFSFAYDLNLSHNHIHGELPSTLKNLQFINSVDLSSNHLSGKLPYFPVGILWLDLSSNSFSGSMVDFLCHKQDNPVVLEFLNLASNNLSGEIPDCWENWPLLVDLNLQSNNFIGNLPSSMGSLSELQSLHLGNNMLSREFPLILKNTSKLILLDLAENNLTGAIPSWIGERLMNLKILRLRSNRFSSNIPNGICGMKLLQDLDLAENRLSGNMPKCFNHLSAMIINKTNSPSFIYSEINSTQGSVISVLLWLKRRGVEYSNLLGLVRSIDLSDNQLSGEIPEEITSLSGLIFLNLSKNQFTGNIPQSIGNMRSLESMDLSRNQLSGTIPSTITNLNFLSVLDLSYNHLKGEIPIGTQLQSFDASSFVGNDLCGPPLLINCSLSREVHSDKDSDGHGVNWFFVSMALGFIVGFWGVLAPLFMYRSWRYTYFRFLDDMWYKLHSCW